MPNGKKLIDLLPPSREVAREIHATAIRASRLRTLYQLLEKIESENAELDLENASENTSEADNE
ncbi:hypothetical protein [Rhodopirellula bahusiensis]|uniref:hypothetical protein n=1 Tax=Rhodopirellula bahusiensis TaxID=2014065 RepID=UPI003266FD81